MPRETLLILLHCIVNIKVIQVVSFGPTEQPGNVKYLTYVNFLTFDEYKYYIVLAYYIYRCYTIYIEWQFVFNVINLPLNNFFAGLFNMVVEPLNSLP